MSEKKKPQVLYPNARMREMVEAIQREQGLNTISDVYFFAVGQAHRSLFPAYSVKRGISGVTQDPDEMAREKIANQEAERRERERVAEAECAQICTVNLKGEVVEGPDGKFCVFQTYNFDTPDEQRVPLDMVTRDFAKHQKVTKTIKK